jgi:hypothetical protein
MVRSDQEKNAVLNSWKEISSYLACDERTCLRWEKLYNLPVHRIGGSAKTRVFAYKDELDAWRIERGNAGATSNAANNSHVKKRPKRKIFLWSLPFLAVVILYMALSSHSEGGTPPDFTIQGSCLVVLDVKGRELGRYDTKLENLVDEKEYKTRFQQKTKGPEGSSAFPYIIIKDVNHDKLTEILFSIQTKDEHNEGSLLCLSSKGQLLWKIETGRELQFGENMYSPDYRIEGIQAIDLDNDGSLEILVISNHLPFFPSELLVLKSDGKVLGEYWNSGRITDLAFVDLNDDGRKEIIAVGVNNEYGKGFIAVFDPMNVRGCSPQINDYYKCKSIEPGSQLHYLLLPRCDVDLALHPQMEAVHAVSPLKNRRISVVTGVSNLFYEFDYDFRIQGIQTSTFFQEKHKELLSAGRIKSILDNTYTEQLKRGILYWGGTKWSSKARPN